MAKGIVDAFELVEIKTENREAFATLDALDLVVELLEQQHSVGQVGQCVMTCHVRNALFRTLTLGHIFMGRQPAAIGDRFVDDGNRPTVRQIHDVIEGFALGDALSKPRGVFVRVTREAAALDSCLRRSRREYRA